MPRLSGLIVLIFAAPASAEPPAQYAEAIRTLDAIVETERRDAGIPGLAIVLVDDQTVVWSKGFGHADAAKTRPVTVDTVFRVGAVSQSIAALVVMQFVDEGKIDLDVPVTKYLPDFKPDNALGKSITLRQLLSHRSGLIREPPVGNYFDSTRPSLEKVVASLNGVQLVYEPGTRTKYSNAGFAAVGRVIEKVDGGPFAKAVRARVLAPLGMTASDFEPSGGVIRNASEGLVATFHGHEFRAPTFELGESPALGLYSTPADLAKMMSAVFAGGAGPRGGLIKPETLNAMLRSPDEGGNGLGFGLEGSGTARRAVARGTVHGFSTELVLSLSDKLGVVVAANKEIVTPTVTRIANAVLAFAAAAKQGVAQPKVDQALTTPASVARKLAARYGDAPAHELFEMGGRLYHLPSSGGFLSELRVTRPFGMIAGIGPGVSRFEGDGTVLRIGPPDVKFHRRISESGKLPSEPPDLMRGLIGEYGSDVHTLHVLEKDGKLHVLIHGFYLYPLEAQGRDKYRFPSGDGLYDGEKLVFTREAGKATAAVLSGIRFPRRPLDGEDGRTFRIKPLKPVEELRKEAMAAKPPEETGDFRTTDLVELIALDRTIKTDLRYATDNNFLGTPLYPKSAKAYMQRPAAEALVRVNKALADMGYGLWVFDSYRPWTVTKMFWEATPDAMRMFVADPSKGSRHNRGCAVDLTLYDLKSGKPVEMVSGYDEFSDRAYPNYWGGTSRQRWRRELLRHAMEDGGFAVYEAEWWHFDFKDWRSYRIGNQTFEELKN